MHLQARFGKHYTSLREHTFRLRQFIASSMRVAKSLLAFLQRNSTYYLQINRYSDLTRAERRQKLGVAPDSAALAAWLIASSTQNSSSTTPTELSSGAQLVRKKRWLFWNKNKSDNENLRQDGQRARLEEKVVYDIDWRSSGLINAQCLNEPEVDQGECGCCYAVAMVRMFEWLHCNQHEGYKPVKFSEQYLVDCGVEFGLSGCLKGNALGVLQFVRERGLIEARQLPFKAVQQSSCLVDADDQLKRATLVPKQLEHSVLVNQLQWTNQLAKGPMVVYVQLSDDFFDYAGGLYEPQECDSSLGHFMLLVGSGRDSKKRPFWLFSNTFGQLYGELGYIRVSRRKRNNCLLYAVSAQADF